MRRYLIIIYILLLAQPLLAQRKDLHDTLRYNQMNEQGVWNVGVGIEPVVGLCHPLSGHLGGGVVSTTGVLGMSIEGGYFVADNMRLSLAVGYVGNSWGSMLRGSIYDAYSELGQFKVRLGAHWHMGRWDVGGGFVWGNSTLRYYAADVTQGGSNIDAYGAISFRDRHPLFGLRYEAGYMLSPFFKVGAFYEPSFGTDGSGYIHSWGARLTIYLPFISAVTCR